MITFLAGLALKAGVSQKYSKVVGVGVAIVAMLALFAILKGCYDQSVIDQHEAERAKATLEAQQKADQDEQARRAAAENRADGIEGAIRNAAEQNPEEARKDAGPATRSALDELRRRQRR